MSTESRWSKYVPRTESSLPEEPCINITLSAVGTVEVNTGNPKLFADGKTVCLRNNVRRYVAEVCPVIICCNETVALIGDLSHNVAVMDAVEVSKQYSHSFIR